MHPLITEFFDDDFLNNKERYSQEQVDDIEKECIERLLASVDYIEFKII